MVLQVSVDTIKLNQLKKKNDSTSINFKVNVTLCNK